MTHPTQEDDVKPIRDALAPFAWCIESLDSADWCWSASVEGVKLNSELLDPGCTPSEPFAVVRKSDHDERIARLLAHIDAQAVRLDAAELDGEVGRAFVGACRTLPKGWRITASISDGQVCVDLITSNGIIKAVKDSEDLSTAIDEAVRAAIASEAAT